MSLNIKNNGHNNSIELPEELINFGSGNIILNGSGIKIKIGSRCTISACDMNFFDGSTLIVGDDVCLAAIEIWATENTFIGIGDRTKFTWHTRIYAHEPSSIKLGSDCLIASKTMIISSDMHSIIECTTRKRINPPKGIDISSHVWLGEGVTVMKGSQIGHGSIIGFGSVVTQNIDPYCLAVGQPAMVKRQGVTWTEEILPYD